MARSLATFPGPVLLVNDRRPDPAAGLHRSVAEAVDGDRGAGRPGRAVRAGRRPPPGRWPKRPPPARGRRWCAPAGSPRPARPGLGHQADVAAVVGRHRRAAARARTPRASSLPGRDLVASFVPGAGQHPGRRCQPRGRERRHPPRPRLPAGRRRARPAPRRRHRQRRRRDRRRRPRPPRPPAPPTALWRNRSAKALATGPPGPVALHVEGVTDGRRLVEAVERLTDLVPVVALVVGRNDVGDLARSHTGSADARPGAPPGPRCGPAGAVLVDDEREMVDALVALEQRPPAGLRRPGRRASSPARPDRPCSSPTG